MLTAILAILLTAQGLLGQRPAREVSTTDFVQDLSIEAPTDGSWAFAMIDDIAIDAAGNIYVLERSDQVIRVFDSSGRLTKSLGRRGDGPGEFRNARTTIIRRDSLWVFDYGNSRVSAFSLVRSGVRTFTVRPSVNGVASAAEVTARGLLVYVNNQALAEATSRSIGRHSPALFVHTNSIGDVLDTVHAVSEARATLRFNMFAADVKTREPAGRVVRAQPFATRALWAMSQDGAEFVTIGQRNDATIGAGAIRISFVSLRGVVLRTKDIAFERILLTDRDVGRIVDSLAKPFLIKGNIRMRGDRTMIRDSLVRPKYWPAYTSLLAGLDGTLWLRSPVPSSMPGSVYWMLSSSGEIEERVALPKDFRLIRASRERVWGWSPDSDGVPVIKRFRRRETMSKRSKNRTPAHVSAGTLASMTMEERVE